jgi:FkbM family methyltransferase
VIGRGAIWEYPCGETTGNYDTGALSIHMDKIKDGVRSVVWINIIASIIYKFIRQNKDTVFLHPSEGCWKTYNFSAGYEQYFPYPNGIFHISERSNEKIAKKYTKKGFVEIESNDIVVDIGAFVGEFSLGISEIANKVIACEPSPHTVHCLVKNAEMKPNINVISGLVGKNKDIKTLRVGTDPTDNSTLDIDASSEDTGLRIGIPSITIRDIMNYIDEDIIDFLKVEAEGAEPEVISGIDKIHVKKVSVDASAERYGEETVEQVRSILENAGYQVQSEEGMVYAKQPEV